MARFIIPKGVDYNFTIKVMEDDSFLPQNLDGFEPLESKLQIIDAETGDATGIEADLTKITEDTIDEVPLIEEVTTLSILEVQEAKYAITINGSEYSVDYSGVNYTITPTNTATLADDIVASFVLSGDNVYDISVISASNMYQVVGNTITLIADNIPENFTIAFNYGEQIAIDPAIITPVTNVPADTSAIATALAAIITSGSPLNITAVATTNQVAITEITGAVATITYTSNLVSSGYQEGTEFVAAGTSTYYNDNGFLKGTILGSETDDVTIDSFVLASITEALDTNRTTITNVVVYNLTTDTTLTITTDYTIIGGVVTLLGNLVNIGDTIEISYETTDTVIGLAVDRGDKVDGYPLKALYQGVVTVNFSDGTPTKTALIDEVYVTHAGV